MIRGRVVSVKDVHVSIRDAVVCEADVLTAIAVRSKAYWGYGEAFMRACHEELTVTGDLIRENKIRVAQYEGQPAGFIHLVREDEEGAFEIEAMFVDPPLIGKGIGAALWHDMMDYLAHVRGRRITVQADPNAEGFYLSVGMKAAGAKESESIPGRMLPLLSMEL